MLDENRIKILIEDTKKQLRSLQNEASPNTEQILFKTKLEERLETLQLIIGEERKKLLFNKMKELEINEWEAIKGAILVMENILISRGFTNQEELQANLLNVIQQLRKN